MDKAYRKQLKPFPGSKGVDVDGQEKTFVAKHVEGERPVVAEPQVKGKTKEEVKAKVSQPVSNPPPDHL